MPPLAFLSPNSTSRRWLAVIILFAVAARVAAALYIGDQVEPMPGTYDQVSYDRLANRVLDGHGFSFEKLWWPLTRADEPTAHWSYLYTLYLAAVYALSGNHPVVARLVQAVLAGVLMPWLAYRLGARHFGERVGLAASGLMAGYAYFIYYAAALMTESFYIMGVLWVLDLAGRPVPAANSPSELRRRGLLLGLALGWTVLLRQVFMVCIPVLFGWMLWRCYARQRDSLGRASLLLLTATLVMVLAIAPWTVRNYLVFDRFVPLNTNAGFAFFWANHPIHGQDFQAVLPTWSDYIELIPVELQSLNEAELDRALLARGLRFVVDDPVRYLALSASRMSEYFMFWPSSESGWISNVSRVLSFGLLWPLMVYGLLANARRAISSDGFILYLFAFSYTAVHLLSWALIRYRLPVDAVLLIFAGAALVDLRKKLMQSRYWPAREDARGVAYSRQ